MKTYFEAISLPLIVEIVISIVIVSVAVLWIQLFLNIIALCNVFWAGYRIRSRTLNVWLCILTGGILAIVGNVIGLTWVYLFESFTSGLETGLYLYGVFLSFLMLAIVNAVVCWLGGVWASKRAFIGE